MDIFEDIPAVVAGMHVHLVESFSKWRKRSASRPKQYGSAM